MPISTPAVRSRIAIAAVYTVAGLLTAVPGPLRAEPAKKAKTVAVEAVTLTPRPLVEAVSAIGTLQSNEAVIVRSEIDGRIVRIGFEEGQPVKQGDVLFRLDDTIFRAELAEAEARRALSQRTYERAKKLEISGHSSAEALDRALAQMRVDEASVTLSKARVEKMTIPAPFDGTVGLRHISVGDYVEAGKDLVNLENIDPIKVEFQIPERYLRVVRPDGAIRVSPDALPGETFDGRIYAIDPRIDAGGRSVSIRARLTNERKVLRPGMFVRVSLIIDRNLEALVLPEEAVVRRGDKQVVFRIIDGAAVITPVTLGLRQTGFVEVVEGLNPGDVVVTAGHAKLREGSLVEINAPQGAKS
tara:strand:- start:189271 stop:190344 length:1074 start_codon:yes stop_codon:yes gene_type:complete